MSCPVCGNNGAREDLSFGGGMRFYCEPCGGFFRISSTLINLAEGKTFDSERARQRLKDQHEAHDPNSLQDPEPTLGPEDADLLVDPD